MYYGLLVWAIGSAPSELMRSRYDIPPTARVARQEAKYLSGFQYHHRGSMAYVGGWKEVVELKKSSPKALAYILRLIYNGSTLLQWLIRRISYASIAASIRNKL